jgi:hypothetical protein
MSGERRHYLTGEDETFDFSNSHSPNQQKEKNSRNNSVALIRFQDKLNLCSGILIAHNLVLTSYHCLEGLSIKNCQVSRNDEQISVLGYVEICDSLDYCVLMLEESFRELKVKMAVDASQPTLLHYSGLFSENTNLLSSGSGYFNSNGEFFGLHQVIGRLAMTPDIRLLPLHAILLKSGSVLSKVLQNQDTESFRLLETDILPIIFYSCPLDLQMTTTMIEIPCTESGAIRGFIRPFPLSPDQEKLFYWLLTSFEYKDFSFSFDEEPATKTRLIKSLCESEFATTNTLSMGAVQLEFLSVSDDQMYFIFQVKANQQLHTDDIEYQKAEGIIGQVELGVELLSLGSPLKDHPLSGTLLSRRDYEKELIKRIRFGFLKSYESQQIQRVCLN